MESTWSYEVAMLCNGLIRQVDSNSLVKMSEVGGAKTSPNRFSVFHGPSGTCCCMEWIMCSSNTVATWNWTPKVVALRVQMWTLPTIMTHMRKLCRVLNSTSQILVPLCILRWNRIFSLSVYPSWWCNGKSEVGTCRPDSIARSSVPCKQMMYRNDKRMHWSAESSMWERCNRNLIRPLHRKFEELFEVNISSLICTGI